MTQPHAVRGFGQEPQLRKSISAILFLLVTSPLWIGLLLWNDAKRISRRLVRIDMETRQSDYEW